MSLLKSVGRVTRDLLQQPEGTVIILGRKNFVRKDFNALQIVIDTIATSSNVSYSRNFDGDAEEIESNVRWNAPCLMNFYGDEAQNEAARFTTLISSEQGVDLQKENNITIYSMNGNTDLSFLTGEQYSERIELSFNVWYTQTIQIPTLRIDTATVDLISNK